MRQVLLIYLDIIRCSLDKIHRLDLQDISQM